MSGRVWLALAAFALASPALAQGRSPAEAQAVVELSRVLGESHALRQACEGGADQVWRKRMQQLLEAEGPEPQLKARLSASFNEAYHSTQPRYPVCTPAARAQARRIAASGKSLSERLESP